MDYPDLPQLESVEYPGGGARAFRAGTALHMTLLVMLLLVLLGCITGATFVIKLQPAAFEIAVPVVLGLMATGAAVWMTRHFMADFHWRTDADSLSARGLVRQRRIGWSDVDSVRYSARAERLTIRSDKTSISLPADVLMLTASAWQHLRRHGKAEGFHPADEVLTFWQPLPVLMSDEIEWSNPKPPSMSKVIASSAGIVCLLLALAWVGGLTTGKPIKAFGYTLMPVLALIFMLLNLYTLPLLRTAKRVSMHGDRLEVDTLQRRLSIPWSEINSAWIYSGFKTLNIRAGRNLVAVPARTSDEDNRRLIIAIVRRLREASPAPLLQIPKEVFDTLSSQVSE